MLIVEKIATGTYLNYFIWFFIMTQILGWILYLLTVLRTGLVKLRVNYNYKEIDNKDQKTEGSENNVNIDKEKISHKLN